MKTNIIELQEQLTELIIKKTQNLNIVNIDKLIDKKRDEITKCLELNLKDNGNIN